MVWGLPSNIVIPVFIASILVGIYLIHKLTKDKTRKISSLRLFIQINALIAIFIGLIVGPFDLPAWQPMGPSPRSLLVGANLLGNQFPDGFSVPVLACYYANGRTVTCAIWQLQAYIFPYWNYSNGYNAIYSTAGLEKIGIVIASLLIASIIFGRAVCGWLCPFGLYQDVLTRIRKSVRLKHFQFSKKTSTALSQSKYIIIAISLILSVVFASYSIFGIQLIPGTTPAGPTGQSGVGSYFDEPFCLVCPMRPLCVLVASALGEIKFSYVMNIANESPFWLTSFYVTSINLVILTVVSVLAFVYRRVWCRICPLGGLTALFSAFTPFRQIAMTRLKKNGQKCTQCGICKRVCPTQASAVYEKKDGDVTESRCILCARCIEECPYDGALTLNFAGKKVTNSRNWLDQQ